VGTPAQAAARQCTTRRLLALASAAARRAACAGAGSRDGRRAAPKPSGAGAGGVGAGTGGAGAGAGAGAATGGAGAGAGAATGGAEMEAYLPELGYLAGGRELHEGFMSTTEARAWCAARRAGAGFTTRAPAPGTPLASVVCTCSFARRPQWCTTLGGTRYAWTKSARREETHKEEL
jgi:hypothetical protein